MLPSGYEINLRPNILENNFVGNIKINLSWSEPIKKISLHAHYDLEINEKSIQLANISWKARYDCFLLNKNYKKQLHGCITFSILHSESDPHIENISVTRGTRMPKKTIYEIHLKERVNECSHCELKMDFEGYIWETTEGLFKGHYSSLNDTNRKMYLATHMRPNMARRVFPCFDEPGFKVALHVDEII